MLTFSYDDMRREIMNHLKIRPAYYGAWKVSTYVLDGVGNKIYDWFITHNEDDYRGTKGEDPQEWQERMADIFLDSWHKAGCPDGIEYTGGEYGEYLVGMEEDEDLEESHRPRGRMLMESDDNTYDVRLREIFRTVQDSRNQINKLYDRLDRFAIALDKSDKREILDDLMDMEETIKGLERKLS